MKTIKYLVKVLSITSLGVYGVWFTKVNCSDLFLIYGVICFLANGLMMSCLASDKFVLEVLKSYKSSFIKRAVNGIYKITWFAIWGQLILNGYFWTGLFGTLANCFALVLESGISDKYKEQMKSSDAV